jgi:hypothetical protein
VVGLEITREVATEIAPHTIGHANVFPYPMRPELPDRGAVPNEGRRWRDVFADLAMLEGERVVQLNHPRSVEPGVSRRAFLSHLGSAGQPFDPTLPLDAAPNALLLEADPETGLRDVDFDAVELLNGSWFPAYFKTREDWFSLLRQGVRWTGTANSDSHVLWEIVAAPRNFVRVADDRIEAFDEAAFVRAIREGRCFGSTGPLLDVRLGDASLGDRFEGRKGMLRVELRTASWVPVSELRVFVNGTLVATRALAGPAVVDLPLEFERDSFVTVEVQGEAAGVYAEVLPEHIPFAFSNPVFVDADGDGSWTPPGLERPDPVVGE